MKHYAGIDVSLEDSSVCVMDAEGLIIRETKVPSEAEALIAWFEALGIAMERIGLEAGPFIAMAVRGDGQGRLGGGASRDPPRPHRFQDHAG